MFLTVPVKLSAGISIYRNSPVLMVIHHYEPCESNDTIKMYVTSVSFFIQNEIVHVGKIPCELNVLCY
jgi:hypothetical protein